MQIPRPKLDRPPIVAALVLITAAALILQCAKNPVTGKREFVLVSEGQEIQLGAQGNQGIVAQYGVVDDPELTAFLDDLGQRMVQVSHRPDLEFTFQLLDDPVVNAFALPGGYVYLTRGILAYLTDEAAMAGVLGHEIGHVTARHGVQQLTQQQLFGLGLGIGSVLSPTFAQYAGLAGNAAGLLLLKFGRDDERQSDRLGVEYATKLGYDTHRMAEFFHTLDRLTDEARSGLPSWASTHPDPGERFEKVHALTDEWQRQVSLTSFEIGSDSYLRLVDGLVFGPNPRHGYVKEGAFLHPDLRFRFPIPDGWKVQNTATQVVVATADGNAGTIFTIEGNVSSPGEAASTFISETGAQVLSQRELRIGGYQAVRVESNIPQEGGTLPVVATWIEKDGNVYAFYGLGAQRTSHIAIADGFRELTDPGALAVRPIVVAAVAAPRSGTFENVVQGFPIPEGSELDVAGLAIMNGVEVDHPIAEGELIKVLKRQGS